MEIEFDDKPKKGGTPKTRLYAPSKNAGRPGGQSAGTSGGTSSGTRKKSPVREPVETFQDEDGFRVRVSRDEVNPLSRVGMILCGFLFAGMVLFMLTGYERITRAYADINTLNDEIEQTNLRITELDVQIECAVTIQDAQEAAERFGMRYPDPSQYVKSGSYIPVTGTFTGAPASTTSAGSAAGDAAPGDAGTPTEGGSTAPEAPVSFEIPDASEDLAG